MLNYDHRSGIECVKRNVGSVFQPCSRTPANACGSSEQCLPLASEKVRSISSAAWFEVRQSLVAFSLIYDRLLAWRSTRDSQQQWPCTMFLLSQRLNSKLVFQRNFTPVT